MSNHENEIRKENIFDMYVEYLELGGWPKGDPKTYAEAARRTESKLLQID